MSPPQVWAWPEGDDDPPPQSGPAEVTLVNGGEGTAYDVRVDRTEGDTVIGGPLVNGVTVHRDESVRLPTSCAGYRHKEVTVSWRVTPEGPTRSRRLSL